MRGAALYAGPAERGSWGLIYLESLMCETPVLGLDRGAMRELTDEGRVGLFVEEASGAAVGRAIVDAMSDPERLAEMGRTGRRFVEGRFTRDRVAETILDHMQGIVAEREGFEPSVPLRVRRISSAVLSTTQPPLRR